MDYLRSCYTCKMIFEVGGEPIDVRWFFTPPGTELFKHKHVFMSRNWDSRECVAGDLGEQPGIRPWNNGASPGRPPAESDCEEFADYFLEGIPSGELAPPVNEEGIPLCCMAPPPCCDCNIPANVSATFDTLVGCDCLSGAVIPLERVGSSCAWSGNGTTLCGGEEVTVEWEVSNPGDICSGLLRVFIGGVLAGEHTSAVWDCSGGEFVSNTFGFVIDGPGCFTFAGVTVTPAP